MKEGVRQSDSRGQLYQIYAIYLLNGIAYQRQDLGSPW